MNAFFALVGIIIVALVVLVMAIPLVVAMVSITYEFWRHCWQMLQDIRSSRKVDPDP